MGNDADEFLSDEDMFSPKKTNRNQKVAVQPVETAPGCKEHYIAKYRKLLNGIPPPPDHTNPDYHLDKLLALWKDNQTLLWEDTNENGGSTKESEEKCPLGICLNLDRSCEEFELMGIQLCERYIWSETSATTSTAYLKLTQSAKKRRKANGWGLSPRTRISYLTRRMTTFQKDNIAAAVAANKTAQILVARSEPGKKVAGKGNGLKGKRALFLSPEHDNKFQTPEQGKSKRLIRRLTLNSSPVRADLERSARNSESSANSSEKKRCSRSLFSTTPEPTSSNHQPQKQQQQQQQIGGLSTQHRQKMLWAVSNALKAVKIRMVDPEFKMYASRLFKATTEKWRASSVVAPGDKKASTSDAMLVAAKSLVEDITGRKMSPKSAKKTAPKSQKIRTPEKTDSRDENNPPVANTPDSVLSEAALNENGVIPLERVGILAEKLDPGGNVSNSFVTPKKSSKRVPVFDESLDMDLNMDFDPEALTSRKRKRQETGRLSPKGTEMMVSQRLRNRTPRKTAAGLSSGPSTSCRSTELSSVSTSRNQDGPEDRLPSVSPAVKRKKLESITPVKLMTTGTPVRQSPRLASNRTPLKSLTGGATPKALKAIFETPSKSELRGGTPLKNLSIIDETPSKPSPDRTPPESNANCETPLKSSAPGYATPSKMEAFVVGSPLKLFSGFGTPSKSSAVRHARGILAAIKTPMPLKQSSLSPDDGTANIPGTVCDGASLDHLTPKKCVTFEKDDKPLLLLPGAFEDDDRPPVLRPVALQRRSARCFSADLPPPRLVRETVLSPAGDESGETLLTPDDNTKTRKTPVSRRRASAPTPGQRSPAVTLETASRSGRKKVSLSLAGARKSKSPEDPVDNGTPTDDAALTPRRSARRALEAPVKSSPNS